MNELKMKDDVWIQYVHSSIDQLLVGIESVTEKIVPKLNNENYLSDKEVADLLKVSRRTLAEYRANGTLPYYALGGKVLYKRSDIDDVMERCYRGVAYQMRQSP